MKKVKLKVKILAGAVVVATAIAAGHTYIANANYNTNTSESSIQLNVEKQDRDTIKLYLSNFGDLTKSLQLSVKIDGGNVKFKEESIKWLMDTSEKKIETNYIMNSDKNKLDLFMVSKDIINSENGVIEICEIDVSKGESILDKLFKSNDGSYRVVPNVVDGEAYSYVRDSTNKRIGGYDIANSSNSKLTINEEPVIKLKDNYSIIDNKIVILKETVFKISDYIEAFDGDGKEIENIEYSGKVDNKKAGSYKITCKATDSFGDSTTLEATVIVENFTKENIPKPVIYGAETPLEIVIGKDFDLKDGISAVDYSGRKLDVKITGDYYTDTPGEYTVTYTANDRFENTTTAERTLLVSKQSSGSEGDSNGPGGNTGGSGESGDSTGPGGNTGGSGESGDITGPGGDTGGSGGSGDVTGPGENTGGSDESGDVTGPGENTGDSEGSGDVTGPGGNTEGSGGDNSDVEKPEIEKPEIEKPGGSGSSNGSSNSEGSSGSNDVNYEIPSKLESIINMDVIKPVDGNGTVESPLKLEVKNISASEFRSFMDKLDKFNVEIDSVEESSNYKIVNLKLTEKHSIFNLLRLFRSSEDMYLSIKVDKNDSALLSVINDFIAGNTNGDFESGNGNNDIIQDEIQNPSNDIEGNDKTDSEDTLNNSTMNNGLNNSNGNISANSTAGDNSNNGIEGSGSSAEVDDNESGNSSGDDTNSDITSTGEVNDADTNDEDTVDSDYEEDSYSNNEQVSENADNKSDSKNKIAAISVVAVIAAGILTAILYSIKKKK